MIGAFFPPRKSGRAFTVLAFACLTLMPAVSPQKANAAQPPSSPFVSHVGQQLYLNGRPWYFTGYNAYQITGTPGGFYCGLAYTDSQLDQLMAQLQQNSGSVTIRAWFFQSFGGPSNWAPFDRVFNAAAAHGIKVIPVLVNQWGDCEPTVTGPPLYKSLAWYQGGYAQTGDGYSLSYRQYAIDMAAHYASNTTIAFWQLVNEAEAAASPGGYCDNPTSGSAMRAFADDVVTAMKAVDPNHLVNLGTMGSGQCGTGGSEYQYVYGGAIDVCEIHDYGAGALPGDPWNGIQVRINQCAALGKPIFAGEVGIDASVQPDWSSTGIVTPTTLVQRAIFFQEKLQAEFDAGMAGFVIWDKSLGNSIGFDVGAGDPTESVMAGQQQKLDYAYAVLSGGQILTAGDPAPPQAPAAQLSGAGTSSPSTGSTLATGGAAPTLAQATLGVSWLRSHWR